MARRLQRKDNPTKLTVEDVYRDFYSVDEIEASLPAWRVEGIELTDREMQQRHIPAPRDGVDGWTARQARVQIDDCVRICRVWSKRKP